MEIKNIDGILFEQMIRCSLQNLICFEEEINNINVFPVSDGDTGTNMRFTLENGINSAATNKDLGIYLKNLSKGMLFGARGNSGVILSQLFKGIYNSLQDKQVATVLEFSDALLAGSELAYKAVVKPVEGTILTVTKQGIVSTLLKITSDTDLLTFFKIYLASLQTVLEHTPELLPILKTNGVLDSGGTGYLKIIEGMKKSLSNEIITIPNNSLNTHIETKSSKLVNSSTFNKESTFSLGYCMEFILQILDSKYDYSKINLQEIIEILNTLGESLVAIQEESIIKIHIHVMDPTPVIKYILQFGEFVSFKLENMELQHNEKFSKQQKDLCIISVANNSEIQTLFTNLGCDFVIEDNNLQTTTSADFINAINQFDAKQFIILPNSKNLIPPANQAKEILEKNNITIIETTNIAQGYYSMAMDDSDSKNIDFRIRQIIEGSTYIKTLLVTTAIKKSIIDDLNINNGDKIFIHNGTIIHNAKNVSSGIIEALNKLDITDKSAFIIFSNDNVTDDASSKFAELLGNNYPDMQQSFIKNPNSIYDFIIGVI